MFELRARAHQAGVVGLCVGELGLRLQHVGLGGDAGGVAVLRDLQRALVTGQRAFEQRLLRVGLAQRKVIGGELALGRELGGGQVGGAGLFARRGAV
jgi:hypothetical protein